MEPAVPAAWTATSALERPEHFLNRYFDVVGAGWGTENSEPPKLSPTDEVQWHMLYEVMDLIVRKSPFTETLDLLRMGLEMCKSDLILATFAAGPIEDFVYYRVKSQEHAAEFEAAIRYDATLMAVFKDGLVWGLDSLPEHVKGMLSRYTPHSPT